MRLCPRCPTAPPDRVGKVAQDQCATSSAAAGDFAHPTTLASGRFSSSSGSTSSADQPPGTRLPEARAPCARCWCRAPWRPRSEEHTSELQSRQYLVCRLLLEKKQRHEQIVAVRLSRQRDIYLLNLQDALC